MVSASSFRPGDPYERLSVERDAELEGLLTITLQRPEKLNALDIRLHDELQHLCTELQTAHDARVVLLTGAGRAFSAGAELGDRRPEPPVNDLDRRARAHLGGRTCELFERLPQVTIAAVNGLAVGGGLVLLTCCDLRIAAESAWFSIPEVALDIPLTWNALPRLVREIGPARTKELVMACDRFSSAEALQWGFVNRVVPDGDLLPRARELAAKLLEKDAVAVAQTKTTVNALANLMVPAEATHADPDYLVLARLLREART